MTAIVYYSLEGNIDFVAREIAKENGSALFRLETVKEYPKKGLLKFFHGGKDTVTGFKPELKEIPDLSQYDKIVIGAPVWAAKPAAPLNTFFDKVSLEGKEVAIFASSAGGNSSKCLEIMREMVESKKGKLIAEAAFTNPLKTAEKSAAEIKSFAEKLK